MNMLKRDERARQENRWVQGLHADDREAFKAMYHFYYPRLSQFVFRYTDSEKTAEDLVHNVFYNVWVNRHSLEPRGTLRAYLYTAVRNQALKHLEKQKVRRYTDVNLSVLQSADVSPEQQLNTKELKEAVIKAVARLPDRRRQIFLMHREDSLTYREISEVLGISVKTVETQMSRSLKFLRNELSYFLPALFWIIPDLF